MTSYQEINIVHDMAGKIVLDYEKDVTYIRNKGEELHLQIIFPIIQPQENKKYPCIVYMISTNEDKNNIYHYVPRLTQFAQRGFVVALMEKPSKDSTYEEQISLLNHALDFLTEHAQTYHIAPDNMFVWRDGTHKDHVREIVPGKVQQALEEFRPEIKAIVCLGEKEQIKEICANLKLEIPPVLMLPYEEEKTSSLEFWTEDVFDIIEDFISNYIN